LQSDANDHLRRLHEGRHPRGRRRSGGAISGSAQAGHQAADRFGSEIGEKKSSAQITKHYSPEALIGKRVLAVVNFPPRQIGKFMSEVLTLGVPDDEGAVVLITPDLATPIGGRLL